MFSGIVEALGEVVAVISEPPGCKIIVKDPKIAPQVEVADSVAVNGCCLTVIEKEGDTFAFQAGPETLERTNLGRLESGSPVNLELALKVDSRLGGHLSAVTSTVRQLLKIDDRRAGLLLSSSELAKQMASKGSVAVDGVSLTLVRCERNLFSVALIPYTLQVTTLGKCKVGDKVNIETDILAKYVQRLAEAQEWD